MANLSASVKQIGESATTSGRIIVLRRNDEMTELANGINGMLQRLDASQHNLQHEKERAQVTLTSIADDVITSNIHGEVIYMNATAERLTGVDATYAAGKSLKNLFHLSNKEAMVF